MRRISRLWRLWAAPARLVLLTTASSADSAPAGSIVGVVWMDANADGTRQQLESGFPDVELILHQNMAIGQVVLRTRTGRDGRFTFEGIAHGLYAVSMPVGPLAPGFSTYPQRLASGTLTVGVSVSGPT